MTARSGAQGINSVEENSIDRKNLLDDLKIERAKLFKEFLIHPRNTRLTLTIKILDDEIADCAEWIRTKNKGTEIPEKNIIPVQNNSS